MTQETAALPLTTSPKAGDRDGWPAPPPDQSPNPCNQHHPSCQPEWPGSYYFTPNLGDQLMTQWPVRLTLDPVTCTCWSCCLYSSRWLFFMCLSLALELQKVIKHWKHCRFSCWSATDKAGRHWVTQANTQAASQEKAKVSAGYPHIYLPVIAIFGLKCHSSVGV